MKSIHRREIDRKPLFQRKPNPARREIGSSQPSGQSTTQNEQRHAHAANQQTSSRTPRNRGSSLAVRDIPFAKGRSFRRIVCQQVLQPFAPDRFVRQEQIESLGRRLIPHARQQTEKQHAQRVPVRRLRSHFPSSNLWRQIPVAPHHRPRSRLCGRR